MNTSGELWAIAPTWLGRIRAALCGDKSATIEAKSGGLPKVNGSVAVLPLHGAISQRSSFWSDLFGGTSTERFGAMFGAALGQANIKAIVLDVDSPGGTVYGVDELSRRIYDARGQKPIYAVANSLAASAAYWIGTSADKLFVAPGGDVGSIGVFSIHEDISALAEKEGVKVTLISAGKYKVEGNPWEPLTEEAKAAWQASVDDTYAEFVSTVARNRGVKQSAVLGGFGQGRVVHAKPAVAEGMADRIVSLAKMLDEMGVGKPSASQDRADAEATQELLASMEATEQGELAKPEPDLDYYERRQRLKERVL